MRFCKARRPMLHKLARYILAVQMLLLVMSTEARAAKFVVSAGAHQFLVENTSRHTSRSLLGIGTYQVSYRHIVDQNLELDVGYSLLATDTFGGDIAFGFDIGANYYPLSG